MYLDMEVYPKQFTYEDLQLLTDDFDVRNFIGRTQFCKVYRGKIPQGWNEMQEQDVTVKIWADTLNMKGEEESFAVEDNVFRFYDEITFLTHPGITGHPNLAKLMGCYYDQNNFGVVYDLKSLDTVHNFIAEDISETFKWMDRMKLIFQLARLLEFLHGQPTQYLVRNISAAHIMVDQDLNPVLFEFGMLTGGKIGKRNEGLFEYPWGSYGYTDQRVKLCGVWTDRTDAFTFGVVLLELLGKCAVDGLQNRENSNGVYFLDEKARGIYTAEKTRSRFEKSRIPDLVHVSFAAEVGFNADDGLELAKLAMKCVQLEDQRPIMGEVVEHLKALQVVRSYAELLLLGPSWKRWLRSSPYFISPYPSRLLLSASLPSQRL